MTGIYKTGTITLNSNSNIVTGDGTLFQTVANAREGDLFTLDGESFYEIYQVDTETQLRIRNLVTGVKYQGSSVSDVNYAIVRNFAASADAQIASDVVNLQQRWHEREREMTEWFASDANYHQITDIRGDKVLVITPTGLNNLVDGPVNIEDFGFPSAKESQALDLNDFPAGIFYTRALSIAHQPPGFGSGIKLIITNKSDTLFYQKAIELDTSKVRYRIATTAANAEIWNTLGSEDGGSAQVTWNDIQGEIPDTATRWPSFQEVTGDVTQILPDTAKRWPSFSEVSGDINSLLADFAKRWPSFEEVTGDILAILPTTATRWPSFTEVTGDITGLQAIIDLVADYEAKDDAVRSDLNTRIDGLEPTFYSVYTDSTSINALDHLNKMLITTSDNAVRVNLLDAPLDSEFSLVQEGQGVVTFYSPKTILNRQGFYKTAGQFANAYARVIEHDGDTHWAIFGDLDN